MTSEPITPCQKDEGKVETVAGFIFLCSKITADGHCSHEIKRYLLPSPLAFNLFQHQGLFQWAGSCITWPKDWNFSFCISPFNEYSRLISLRIDWFDLLAVQRTVKTLVWNTIQKHQFFGGQLSLSSNSHIHIWLLEKPQLWLYRHLLAKWYLCFQYSV